MHDNETQPTITTLLEAIQQGFAQMNERFDRIEKRLDKVERSIRVLSEGFVDIRADLRGFEDRIEALEKH